MSELTPNIPDFQCAILATTDQQPAIRAKTAHIHRSHMPSKCSYELSITCVPELNVIVKAGAGDIEAVWGENYMVDLFLVAHEAGKGFGRGGGLPEENCEVVAGSLAKRCHLRT